MINRNLKEKRIGVYEIFKKNEDPSYPDQLAKLIEGENYEHEIEKAEYLLNMWVASYKNMLQIEKSTYYSYINKFLKRLTCIFQEKTRCEFAISTMYWICYKKWQELTDVINKGLRNSDIRCLVLLWRISHCMIESTDVREKEEFGKHLSEQFESNLRLFRWRKHEEKMYILQIIKYINSQFQYQAFIENGEQWTKIIKDIKEAPFKSEIPKDKKQLELFKFEHEENKRKAIELQGILGNQKANKKGMKAELKEKIKMDQEKEKEYEKELLARKEINVFLVVKDKTEEEEIYRIEILSEIINCRPIMCEICEDFWESLTLNAVTEICDRMEELNYKVRTDVLMSKLFLNLLKYRKTGDLIREKIGEDIVVKIIKNIELNESNSPFEQQELSQIPTLVNEAFFYISPEEAERGITIESIIISRIKNIISEASYGRDDVKSRSLMMVSCREEIVLVKSILSDIVNFIIAIKKKKSGLAIETYIILVKILLSSYTSPEFWELGIDSLARALTESDNNFQNNPKVGELRKLNIQLLNILYPMIVLEYPEQVSLNTAVVKWIYNIEKNMPVYTPLITLFTIMVDKTPQFFKDNSQSASYLNDTLEKICEKLGHEHTSENLFAYIECLLKIYIRIRSDDVYLHYCNIPDVAFNSWEIILKKQARIIFKREDIKKYETKLKEEYEKKNKNKNLSKKEQQAPLKLYDYTDLTGEEKEKKYEEIMMLYFGEKEKEWLKNLITNHESWGDEYFIKSEFAILEFSLIQTISKANLEFYTKYHLPNEFMKGIIAELDEDLYNLFKYLMETQNYQLLFIFCSKIFFMCRDFFFVKGLKSYQLVQSKCFEILSIFFNKVEILYASSLFCSLLIPHIDNPPLLKKVYDDLNFEEFLTDLFKGSNEFIGKEKCYFPWLIKLLIAYQATEHYREKEIMVKSSLMTLSKNVVWWGNVDYMINAEIDIDEDKTKEKRKFLFEIFKEEYKTIVDKYFSSIHAIVKIQIKERELGINQTFAGDAENEANENKMSSTE